MLSKVLNFPKVIFILILAIILVTISCKEKSELPQPALAKQKLEAIPSSRTYTVPDSFKIGIGNIVSGYLKVQKSLAADDFPKAAEEFSLMHGILHTLPEDALDSSAKAGWDSISMGFMKVLHPMAASENIAVMRNHFAEFTPLLVNMIEKIGMMGVDSTNLFHCPMAKDNKGADWLQRGKVKANPYQGKAMPDCGEFVKEIKP